MSHLGLAIALQSTQPDRTAGAVFAIVILVGVVVGFVALGITNSRANSRLRAADEEVRRLRYELGVLSRWSNSTPAAAPSALPPPGEQPPAVPLSGEGYPLTSPVAANWFADPRMRHQLRYWDGTSWTGHVADNGLVSRDDG